MSDEMKKKEEEVFAQSLNDEELESVNGGWNFCDEELGKGEPKGPTQHCVQILYRNIYVGGFANCAATVEDGSWCGNNDACYGNAVMYTNMKNCAKAWR